LPAHDQERWALLRRDRRASHAPWVGRHADGARVLSAEDGSRNRTEGEGHVSDDVLDDPAFTLELALAVVRATLERATPDERRELHDRLFGAGATDCERDE
jgi:hypothetical protein